MRERDSGPPQQMVTFRTGEYSFGIDVLKVQEVLKHQQMTRVPRASGEVRGLINLRGHIVTAIGMRERLSLDGREDTQEEMNLIVSLRDGVASLVVDSVGDVITLDPAMYKPRPRALKAPLKEMVLGVYESDKGMLLHLAPEVVCGLCEEEDGD
jgi:purine-binding chemotaxis protein CheW